MDGNHKEPSAQCTAGLTTLAGCPLLFTHSVLVAMLAESSKKLRGLQSPRSKPFNCMINQALRTVSFQVFLMGNLIMHGT